MPAYQIEFNKLMQDAINNYKTKNKITITTKEIHNNIQHRLHQKLIIDYIASLNFREMDNYQIARITKYCRNFIKADIIEDLKAILKAIQEARISLLIPLPDTPQEISTEISNQLPFALPIQKRSQTKGIVNTL